MPRFSVIATAWAIGAASMGIAAPPGPVGGERAVMDRFEPGAVMIRFEEGASQGQRQSANAAVGGKIRREFPAVPGLASLEIAVPAVEGIDLLERMPGVLYAEPNFYMQPVIVPNDPAFFRLWGMHNTGQTVNGDPGVADADIGAAEAWDLYTGNPNMVIAVVDTGVNYNHPDLAAYARVNPGEIAGNSVDDDGNGFVDDVRG